ncbi:AraC family transcriptional regulator [Cytobacillus gottheilii]|uniref:AraC family transcriptional regulator n=1 Tax=Cytobacillus gottheilii TaxID=859144 RepID=UPI00082ABE45|nr:response regulator transcription factor [Cytobacillus gottheilii]
MNIFIIDRDENEARGLQWYLQSYLLNRVEVIILESMVQLNKKKEEMIPDIIIVEMELIQQPNDFSLLGYLREKGTDLYALTAEPLFKHALKAIQLQVTHLFVKPVDLELLKEIINTSRTVRVSDELVISESENSDHFYMQLFSSSKNLFPKENQLFFLIEPDNRKDIISLYKWLNDISSFMNLKIYPLTKRIICVSDFVEITEFEHRARTIMREWNSINDTYINIAVYDGVPVTLNQLYSEMKKSLNQRFYKGFEHIFYVSKHLVVKHLDPLLTPEDQQLWITSLENHDISSIKNFLYTLSAQGSYYEEDLIRIYLTSVLAQIRRFMKKYDFQQKPDLEEKYLKLFRIILEHPILYTIIQEMILFTQSLMKLAKNEKEKANYGKLTADLINDQYTNTAFSLSSAADTLGITPNYLSAVFSKYHEIPFKRYLQQYRLEQSKNTLIHTELTISEVAHANGFEDPNYYSKTFKEYAGLPPNRYRKRQRWKVEGGMEL